jgi:hypothetical protein
LLSILRIAAGIIVGVYLDMVHTALTSVGFGLPGAVQQFASSEKSVGEGERQRCLSMRNVRNFLQVESNDLC